MILSSFQFFTPYPRDGRGIFRGFIASGGFLAESPSIFALAALSHASRWIADPASSSGESFDIA
jgi:hypothetical protein